MPLMGGSSKKAISHNIGAEMDAGKPHNQAIAIALSQARRARKRKMAMGGMVDQHDETHEYKVEDDLFVPMHEDSSGEPQEKGKYEEEEPMEYMAHGGITGGIIRKNREARAREPKHEEEMPKLAFGGHIEAERHLEPRVDQKGYAEDGDIEHDEEMPDMEASEPHGDEEMPHMADGGEIMPKDLMDKVAQKRRLNGQRMMAPKGMFAGALRKKHY